MQHVVFSFWNIHETWNCEFFGSIKKTWNLQWSLCCRWVWNMKTQKLPNESECKGTCGCEKHKNTKVKVKGPGVLSVFSRIYSWNLNLVVLHVCAWPCVCQMRILKKIWSNSNLNHSHHHYRSESEWSESKSSKYDWEQW